MYIVYNSLLSKMAKCTYSVQPTLVGNNDHSALINHHSNNACTCTCIHVYTCACI